MLSSGNLLQIENQIDLSSSRGNEEISMRVSSTVDSGDTFFTDLNGFQVQPWGGGGGGAGEGGEAESFGRRSRVVRGGCGVGQLKEQE